MGLHDVKAIDCLRHGNGRVFDCEGCSVSVVTGFRSARYRSVRCSRPLGVKKKPWFSHWIVGVYRSVALLCPFPPNISLVRVLTLYALTGFSSLFDLAG